MIIIIYHLFFLLSSSHLLLCFLCFVFQLDIVNGELKMILGFMWTTFRKVGLSSLNSKGGRGGANPEEDLLNWVREKVQPYGVDVVSFRQSFNDGVAWAALVDAFDPDYLNFASIDRNNREATLNAVFDAAEKRSEEH